MGDSEGGGCCQEILIIVLVVVPLIIGVAIGYAVRGATCNQTSNQDNEMETKNTNLDYFLCLRIKHDYATIVTTNKRMYTLRL